MNFLKFKKDKEAVVYKDEFCDTFQIVASETKTIWQGYGLSKIRGSISLVIEEGTGAQCELDCNGNKSTINLNNTVVMTASDITEIKIIAGTTPVTVRFNASISYE